MKIVFLAIFGLLAKFGLAQSNIPTVPINTLEGKEITSSALTDSSQLTVISFWATWCKPCMQELDAISEDYDDWQQTTKSRLVAIAIDDSRSLSGVRAILKGRGWPFEAYLDPNQNLKRALNIPSVPYTLVLDKTGKIIYRHSGYTPGSEKELKKFLKKQNS